MLRASIKRLLLLGGRIERRLDRHAPAASPDSLAPEDVRTILLWSMDRLGDLVRATPAIRAIRSRFPAARIAMLSAGRAGPILRENPHLDELHVVADPYGPRAHCRVWRALRQRTWDLAVLLEADEYWDALGGLYCRTLQVRHVVRFDFGRGVPRSHRGVRVGRAGSWIDQFNQLAAAAGATPDGRRTEVFLSAAERAWADSFLTAQGVDPVRAPYFLLHPGGNFLRVSRQWPPERFAELVTLLHRDRQWPIILTGVAAEQPTVDEIRRQATAPVIDLCGRLNLRQLAALIDRAAVCIMNDTGPLHVAHALGRPTVAILGPTAPEVVGVPPHARVVRADLPCSPCAFLEGWRACTNPVQWECLHRIQPMDVLTAALAQADAPVKASAAPYRSYDFVASPQGPAPRPEKTP